MSRRFGLVGLLGVCSVCLLFLLASHQLANYGNYHRRPTYLDLVQSPIEDTPSSINYSGPPTINEVINRYRDELERELSNYKYPDGKTLADFVPEQGGRPLRNIIVTTWRSGSTFLGELIDIPGSYYHYEPLLDFGIIQIRGPPKARRALYNLRNLLNCDYSDMEHYLNFGKQYNWLFTHNNRLWNQCLSYPQFCFNHNFLNQFCRLFPFQSMKVVRLRLSLAEELLADKNLNVRVVLLVRDPRGTIQSRKHREWCPGNPDCDSPMILCDDLVADYKAAVQISNLYPDRFRVLRYEDLSMDPYRGAMSLFEFFQLYMHPKVLKFLESHTKTNVGGASSTFRDSRNAPFHWRQDLNFSEVQNIEEQCVQAMKLWGYARAHNETSLRDMNPLLNYTLVPADDRRDAAEHTTLCSSTHSQAHLHIGLPGNTYIGKELAGGGRLYVHVGNLHTFSCV